MSLSAGSSEPGFGGDVPGTLVEGRYRVIALLGAGGMGSVYRAQDERMARPVVLKVPHASHLAQEGFRRRFEQEIRSLTTLEHPSIVKAFDVGTHGGMPYAVLQYLGGGSLAERLAKAGGKIPPAEVMRWLPRLADALDYIHARGMVHRDVKPANILLDESGHAFVADLGIAKVLGETTTGLTQAGQTPGSPEYMAPEVLSGAPAGPAYDQYALGVVVYQAVSGRSPFVADNPLAVLVKKRTEPPAPLLLAAPDVPPAAAAAVMRAIDADPASRFPSCLAFARAFAAGLKASPEEQARAAAEARAAGSAHGPGGAAGTRRRRIQVAAAAVVLGVIAVVLALSFGPAAKEAGPRGVEVRVEAPAAGQVLPSREVRVSGSATGDATTVRINGAPVAVRDGRFATTVAAPGQGAFAIEAQGPSPSAPVRLTVTIDTESPTVEITDPAAPSATYPGASAVVRGRVIDANPADLRMNGVVVPLHAGDPAFEVTVPLAKGADTVVAFEAVDRAGNVSARVTRTLRSAGEASAWSAALEGAKMAAAAGDWESASSRLVEAKAKGAPSVEIPAALIDGVDSHAEIKEALSRADAHDWEAVRARVLSAKRLGATDAEVPRRLLDGLLAQDRMKEALVKAAAGDFEAAEALLKAARGLGATDGDLPRRLADALAVHDRLARATERAKAMDWTAVRRLVDEARSRGASDADVPTALREGLARYDAPPMLELLSPKDGETITVSSILVRGRFGPNRPSDELRVVGSPAFIRDDALGSFEATLSPEGLRGTKTGVLEFDLRVVDGEATRANVHARLAFREAPWTAFLDGWAQPEGPEVDKATGFPARVRRLKDSAVMILAPAGPFRMGSGSGRRADEKPAHAVTLSHAYYVDVSEVTNAQFARFAAEAAGKTRAETTGRGGWLAPDKTGWVEREGLSWRHPSPDPVPADLFPRLPVVQVTWDEATAFASWAGVSLPTEAQFEKLGSGIPETVVGAIPEVSPATVGNVADEKFSLQFAYDYIKGLDDGYAGVAPVESFRAHGLGWHDLTGNVWEWCADWYAKDYYARSASKDPRGPPTGTARVLRGGSWSSYLDSLYVTSRLGLDPATRRGNVGFRCARSLP